MVSSPPNSFLDEAAEKAMRLEADEAFDGLSLAGKWLLRTLLTQGPLSPDDLINEGSKVGHDVRSMIGFMESASLKFLQIERGKAMRVRCMIAEPYRKYLQGRLREENAMKINLGVLVALGLFLIPAGIVAGGADEVHAYALAFEFTQAGGPPPNSCPSGGPGWIWIARLRFLGPGIVEGGDVSTIVCNGDTPQRIRKKLTDSIQQLAADRGYAVRPVNIVVPTLQRGE